jgi:glycosyltransferase involved in cell wall biosynthesis
LRFGEDLATYLAAPDILVFPSRTDTFGLVNLEALACGVPVAAYPLTGPIDVVADGVTGALDEDLACAAARALKIDPRACRARALQSALEHLQPSIREPSGGLRSKLDRANVAAPPGG